MNKTQVIKQIADYYKISRNIDFAAYFEVSPQVALSWTKDGRYNIYEVYERCPDIDPEWLLSLGEKGEMLRKKDEGPKTEEQVTVSKALDNVRLALDRIAEEQQISRRILDQSDRMLKLMEGIKAE